MQPAKKAARGGKAVRKPVVDAAENWKRFYHARTCVRMTRAEVAKILADPRGAPDSDDDEDGAPVMHLRQIQQACGINRVRVMPQHSSTIATWGDDGRVQVGKTHLNASQTHISLLASSFGPQRCTHS